jgi:nitrile hydratase
MDGVYDLGGMQGFGKIEYEQDEPVFHEPWQATAFSLMFFAQATLRSNNADEYRHSVERMAPPHYFQAHYYERMLTGATTLLVEKGVLALDDLEQRAGGPFPLSQPVAGNPVADLEAQPVARFAVGDRVRVKAIYPGGHIRAPRFCRGKPGIVLRVAPTFTFPDTSAHGGPRRKEHTYHVEFASGDLWDEPEQDNNSVIVDLWDSYLEAAQ